VNLTVCARYTCLHRQPRVLIAVILGVHIPFSIHSLIQLNSKNFELLPITTELKHNHRRIKVSRLILRMFGVVDLGICLMQINLQVLEVFIVHVQQPFLFCQGIKVDGLILPKIVNQLLRQLLFDVFHNLNHHGIHAIQELPSKFLIVIPILDNMLW
jgi:hypothetical protein